MSKAIIAAVRQLPQLKGSLLLTAIELAHRADGSDGTCRVSYSFLARKTRLHPRTMMRHITRLVRLKIIRRQCFTRRGAPWGVNRYIFRIRWRLPTPAQMVPMTQRDTGSQQPKREEKTPDLERGKWGTSADQERWFRRGLTFWTPGSLPEQWARGA